MISHSRVNTASKKTGLALVFITGFLPVFFFSTTQADTMSGWTTECDESNVTGVGINTFLGISSSSIIISGYSLSGWTNNTVTSSEVYLICANNVSSTLFAHARPVNQSAISGYNQYYDESHDLYLTCEYTDVHCTPQDGESDNEACAQVDFISIGQAGKQTDVKACITFKPITESETMTDNLIYLLYYSILTLFIIGVAYLGYKIIR